MPKFAELKREFRKAGCFPVKNSKHQRWYSPITKQEFPMSHHDQEEIKKVRRWLFASKRAFRRNIKEEFL